MRRLLALLLVLLAAPAWADMFQDGSNAKFPQAQINLGVEAAGNPAKFDPLCDGSTIEADIAAGTAHDCTAAINAAALVGFGSATTVNVQLQPGRYYLTGTINLLSGQTLRGAGRSKTFLRIRDTFSPAAAGVIVTDLSGGVRDLAIVFDQATTQSSRANFQNLGTCTSTGTGCKYPPAILLTSGRTVIENVRIEKAWDGIAANSVATVNSPGGVGNSVLRLLYVEVSAFNTGLWLDGAKDESQIEGYHFWNFGFSSGAPIYTGVFSDGNVDCLRVGNADGFRVANFFCHAGNMRFTDSLVSPGDAIHGSFANVMLDHGARFIVEAANILIVTNLMQSAGPGMAVPPNCSFTMNAVSSPADRVQVTNYYVANHPETVVCIYKGNAFFEHVRLISHADRPSVLVDGGSLWMRDSHWSGHGAVVRTAPVIQQLSGGMVLSGMGWTGPTVGGGGVAVQLTTDASSLTDLNLGGYGFSFGCGPTTAGWCFTGLPQGLYDLPTYSFSHTTTPIITGSSDFAPTNRNTAGQWWLRGNKVEFWLREEFDTNAYATGNNFQIQTTLPLAASGLGSSRTCNLNVFQKVAGYTALEPRCGMAENAGNTALDINFTFPVAGGTSTNVQRANIPASTADFVFGISGWYPIR